MKTKITILRKLILICLSLFISQVSFSSSSNFSKLSPEIKDAGNAVYHGIYQNQEIFLKDGKWSGPPFIEGGSSRPAVGLIKDFTFSGDIDGNGTIEQVVFLWESSGGSGTRVYMSILGSYDNNIVNLSTHLIGDRVQLRMGRVHQGKIELDVIQAGKNDAACCPTNKVLRSWSFRNNQLFEEKPQSLGTLSFADLEGVKWTLTHMNWREALPEKIKITLTINDQKASGQSGCNRYFSSIKAGEKAGDLIFSKVGSTRMACPGDAMELESRFLNSLSNVIKYSFVNGKLALTYKNRDTLGTLLFTAQ